MEEESEHQVSHLTEELLAMRAAEKGGVSFLFYFGFNGMPLDRVTMLQ